MTNSVSTRNVIALIFGAGTHHQTDYSALEIARTVADQRGGSAVGILISVDADDAKHHARVAGIDTVVCIPPASSEPLQTHQLLDMLMATLKDSRTPRYYDESIFITAMDPMHEEIAGRVAARLSAVPLGRIEDISFSDDGEVVARRVIFGGRMNATAVCQRGPYMMSMRKRREQSGHGVQFQSDPKIVELDHTTDVRPTYLVSTTAHVARHRSLQGAKLVVSGGRGAGGTEGFELIHQLANKLDAAVGGSLPAVDAGWIPVSHQIGQSGKYVTSDTYIAIGISGTPQHLAGIDTHTKIIAINNDPDASIFKEADVGVVADWLVIGPHVLARLQTEDQHSD